MLARTPELTQQDPDLWIRREGKRHPRALPLFCFPYAGGSAAVFRGWISQLGPDIEVLPVELPGHGRRWTEPCLTDVQPIVEAAAHALLPLFQQPFSLFGHSLGALLCFELARYLEAVHGLRPVRLIVSGRPAPQSKLSCGTRHLLPDECFISELQKLNGTPAELLQERELLTAMLPVLRADFGMSERYCYRPRARLGTPIAVFGGINDPEIGRADLLGWRDVTAEDCTIRMFPGDHFFIHTAHELVIRMVRRELMVG